MQKLFKKKTVENGVEGEKKSNKEISIPHISWLLEKRFPCHYPSTRTMQGHIMEDCVWVKLSGKWVIPSYTEVQHLPDLGEPCRQEGLCSNAKQNEEITMTQDGKKNTGETTFWAPDMHSMSSAMWCSAPGEVRES